MYEHPILDESGVRVTASRIVVGTHTYQTRAVNAVTTSVQPPKRAGAILCFIVTAVCLWKLLLANGGAGSIIMGTGAAALGVWAWMSNVATYGVTIVMGGATVRVVTSTSKVFIDRVIAAINSAVETSQSR